MKLTNSELNAKIISLTRQERKITQEILQLINLVEERQLHLEMGYASIFDYLVQYLGYNESSAYRRMQAARLLKEIPEIKEKIQSGALHLTQLASFQSAIRAQDAPVAMATKREILEKLQHANSNETKKILQLELPHEEVHRPTVSYTHDGFVNLTLRLSTEQFEKLNELKNIVGNSADKGNFEGILYKLVEQELERVTKIKNPPKVNSGLGRVTLNRSLRKMIFDQNHYECQFRDTKTNRQCRAKRFLEIEHKIPIAFGGCNAPENLTVLCRNHNQFRAYKLGLGPPAASVAKCL